MFNLFRGVGDDYWKRFCNEALKTLYMTNRYKEGDILVGIGGQKRKVLGVCGEIRFLSHTDDFDGASSSIWTEKELEKNGFTLEQPRWKPEQGDVYWFLNLNGEVYLETWMDGTYDNFKFEIGNCFLTELQAQKYKQWLLDHSYKPE
jgi:hypothetical protein